MLVDERPFDLAALGWLFEINYDGRRCLAEFGNGLAYLRSESGADITHWFPQVVKALAAVPGGPHVTDGEVVSLVDIGRSDCGGRAVGRFVPGDGSVLYCAFDVLVLDGTPVMDRPLIERKANLGPLLGGSEGILPVGHFQGDGRTLFDQAVIPLKLEELVAKRADSVYRPGIRSPDWVKVKRNGAVLPKRFEG